MVVPILSTGVTSDERWVKRGYTGYAIPYLWFVGKLLVKFMSSEKNMDIFLRLSEPLLRSETLRVNKIK